MRKRIGGGVVLLLACVILAGLVLAGCATKITLEVQRTPTLDTREIKRLAVMPFGGSYSSAAQHATTVALNNIQETNQFTLVSSSRINDARRAGESLEDYVDALFVGQISNISEKNTSQTSSYKNKDGQTVTYTTYIREVSVNFSYHLERARDGSMIGPVMKGGTQRSSSENPSALQSAATLANSIISSQLRYLYRDLVIHTIMVQRKMEKDPDKNLKQPMEAALAQVKAGSYMAANKAYIAIWDSNQSVAAAVNASILYEAMGETQNAANFMQQVLEETGNPMARSVLARLNNELAQQAGVEEFDEAQSPMERVTNTAISKVEGVLPAEPKIMIHNNSTRDQNIVSDVIDNMTSIFVNKGVPVVERQMIDMVLKEQNFQLSGSVSDNDLVSIGNLAGANTIVVIAIAGTGTSRRLQLRVLDIKRGTVSYQSGTGSEWNL